MHKTILKLFKERLNFHSIDTAVGYLRNSVACDDNINVKLAMVMSVEFKAKNEIDAVSWSRGWELI